MNEQIKSSDVYRQAFQEIKDKRNETLKLTSDIDVIWVLSQPGTYLEPSKDGAYNGLCLNKTAIDHGVSLVKQIILLRLKEKGIDKDLGDISEQEITDFGPFLFYNGEDKDTPDVKDLQNEDFKKVIDSGDFPLPKSKIIIDHIDEKNTLGQVSGFMKFFKDKPNINKVAIITSLPHSTRVSRYLEDYRIKHPDSFLPNIEFIGAWIPKDKIETDKSNKERTLRGARLILQEIRKAEKYYQKGDLAKDPLKGL
jgi:hypothetical protein